MTLVCGGLHNLSSRQIGFDQFDFNVWTRVFADYHQRWGQVADRLERGREACEARLEALEKHARFEESF